MDYSKAIKDILKDHDEKKTVKVKDANYAFLKPSDENDNRIMYDVFIKKYADIGLGLTIMYPGDVNGEFFMTKGHFHTKHKPELYFPFEGTGKLLLQKGSDIKVINLKKGENYVIPKSYAHRLINTGRKNLIVLTVYHLNCKSNYKVKFKKRFFK